MKKPKRITGRATPDPTDEVAQARAERAEEVAEAMWVDTKAQRAILNAIRRYMRQCKKKRVRKGIPVSGRRLSQLSQVGKSAIAERLIAEIRDEDLAAGRELNPYRVIHITVDAKMTVKMLFQEILNRLADDFTDKPSALGLRITTKEAQEIKGTGRDNTKILEQRIEEWVGRLGVELIIVDEIQRLVAKTDRESDDPDDPTSPFTPDALAVTEKLQAFLDRGVVPMFFIGDETSTIFFKLNPQFSARLHKPLKLAPLNMTKARDQMEFSEFCKEYDSRIVAEKVTSVPTCLTQPAVLTALMSASGGHVGRAARLIQVALSAAMERGAITMEPYDLSNAVRDYAIGLGWVELDPFSVQLDPAPAEPVAASGLVDA